jgi:hypothetical protein
LRLSIFDQDSRGGRFRRGRRKVVARRCTSAKAFTRSRVERRRRHQDCGFGRLKCGTTIRSRTKRRRTEGSDGFDNRDGGRGARRRRRRTESVREMRCDRGLRIRDRFEIVDVVVRGVGKRWRRGMREVNHVDET